MQLKKGKKISGVLATATCALLGMPSANAAEDSGWKIDTAYLMYSEKNRVDANEPTLKAQKTFADDSKLNFHIVLDTLTGASPSGAAPSSNPQTFTSPSAKEQYTVAPGEIPLDTTFKDMRTEFGASWDAPINRLMRYNVGFNTSAEHDYSSFGVNGGLSHDFNRKNTTVSLGLAFDFDTIKPEGGIPTPLSAMVPAGSPSNRSGADDTKSVADVVLGLAQVIDAATIMQFNLSLNHTSGYLNDPYKVVSVVDAAGEPLPVNGIVYESRPGSRNKESIYWDTRHHTSWGDTFDVSYRYMTDDWGINSHTVDVHYRWNLAEQWYLEPHARWYQQTEANFYHHNLTAAPAPGMDVSADSRLAAFDATTLGAKVGYIISPDSEVNFRLESYQQTGKTTSADAIGIQKNYDLTPNLDATIVQIGYSFKF